MPFLCRALSSMARSNKVFNSDASRAAKVKRSVYNETPYFHTILLSIYAPVKPSVISGGSPHLSFRAAAYPPVISSGSLPCHFERQREIFNKQDSSSLTLLGMTER